MASKKYDPVECARRLDLETKFYTPELHKASFVLPQMVKDIAVSYTHLDVYKRQELGDCRLQHFKAMEMI